MLKQTPEKRVLFVRRIMPVALAVFGVFSFAFMNLRAPKVAYATTADTINFQARLQGISGAIVPDGDYNIEFKLYDASSSSGSLQGSCTNDAHCLWVETRTSTDKVTTKNGYLSVSLGSVNAFPSTIDWSQHLWLTMNIGGTGTASWDGEMNPRLPLTAVPYAFQAGRASTADQLSTTSGSNTSTLSIQAPTGGSQTFVIQDQGAAGAYDLLTTNKADASYIQLQGATPVAQTGSIDITGAATVGSLQVSSGGSISVTDGTLTLGGSSVTTYTSPHGASISTKINIPNFNPGVSGQIIALGLPSTADATSRAITVLDARTAAHQPSIALLSPDENQVFGLSWDGSDTTAALKSSTSAIALQVNGLNALTANNESGVSVITLGGSGGSDGVLQFSNAGNSAQTAIKATGLLTSYTINLPSGAGSVAQCLTISGLSGSVETLGYRNCASTLQDAYTNSGSSGNILLNSTTKGITLQDASSSVGGNLFAVQDNAGTINYLAVTTSGVNVGGTATASTSVQAPNFDTASAGALTIGNTHASSISLGSTSSNIATTINGTALIKPTSGNDSTAAFQVQNASAQSVLNVSTSTDTITLFSGTPSYLGSWASTSAINGASPQALYGHTTVTANGYIYVMGGALTGGTSYSNGVYYAKVNADGTISSSWTASSNTLPYPTYRGVSFVANGYIYYIGGYNGAAIGTYAYARLNSDGSIGSWTAVTTNTMPGGHGRSYASSVYLNGYIYLIGGYDNNVFTQNTIYAKVNADGTLGAWNTATASLGSNTLRSAAVAANGYIYVIDGGSDKTAGSALSSVLYAQPSPSTGDISSWTAGSSTLTLRSAPTAVVSNGYVYVIGGVNGTGALGSIEYAKVPAAGGALGSWSTSPSTLGANTRWDATSVTVNGYTYVIGGNSGNGSSTTAASTIYYASTNRIQVSGSLDLVGLQGATLADGGSDQSTGSTGGSITAGNGTFVGSLQVQGQATFNQTLAINGSFSVGGVFAVDPTAKKITIGPATGDTTGTLLVLGNKTNTGDPTEVDGAMYYNSSTKSFRCGVDTVWVSCVGGLLTSTTAITSTVTNTTTDTAFSPSYTLPANYCQSGRVLHITASGVLSSYVAGTGNELQLKVKLGGTTVAISDPDQWWGVESNDGWTANITIVCPNAPGSTTVTAQGVFSVGFENPKQFTYQATTVDTSTSLALTMSGVWAQANVGNSVTLHTLVLESSGP